LFSIGSYVGLYLILDQVHNPDFRVDQEVWVVSPTPGDADYVRRYVIANVALGTHPQALKASMATDKQARIKLPVRESAPKGALILGAVVLF
jgi:hypothetical protein